MHWRPLKSSNGDNFILVILPDYLYNSVSKRSGVVKNVFSL